MTHIIQQQYLHAELDGSETDGFGLQKCLPDLCRRHVIPAIGRILDQFAPTSGHWYIERLEIDLGTLAYACAGEDWEAATEQALSKVLREQQPFPTNQGTPDILPSQPGKNHHPTEQEYLHTAFLYFLANGSLPWFFHLTSGKTLEQQLLSFWQEAKAPNSFPDKQALLSLLASTNIARQRLVWQFSTNLYRRLLEQLSPAHLATISLILRTPWLGELPPAEYQLFSRNLWETAFLHLSQRQEPNATRLLEETLDNILASGSAPDFHTSALSHRNTHTADSLSSVGASPAGDSPAPPHPNLPPPGGKKQEVHLSSVLRPALLAGEGLGMGGRLANMDIAEHPTQNTLYTGQAGLVLLHPFLPRFFEALGIADGDKLLQPERAPGLLYFLATGQLIAPEYELGLPKTLCNLPLNTPLLTDIGITPAEQDEASALLEAVIRHWSALRNTSPDGLRGNFLNRLGKLSPHPDGGWLLQVETQTHDILLDQLPWGIGMIKLPWMPHLLRVEWRT
jgi:hypothetical protein